MKAALINTPKATASLFVQLEKLSVELSGLMTKLNGDSVKQSKDEATIPSIRSRVGQVSYSHWETTQSPTETQKTNIDIATNDFDKFQSEMRNYLMNFEVFESNLEEIGAPYTPNRKF